MSTQASPRLALTEVMFTRPPSFVYKDGELHCERVPLSRLAREFGTPLYVYSATMIRDRYKTLDLAFKKVEHTLSYSVKANSNLSILRLLASLGSGFDIVSGGELERVLLARKKSVDKVVFSGVGKTEEELLAALRARILIFNVESEGELELLARCAKKQQKIASVAFRVNPDVPAETHPYISTGLSDHKFGIPIGAARELYRQAARQEYLEIAGVSVHIGSQINELTPFRVSMEKAAELVSELAADGHKIRFVDAGGGLGISYSSNQPVDFDDLASRYADCIIQPLEKLNPHPHILLEPGRSIVAPAGVLVTRVLYQKQNGRKRFTIVDAAMNDLIRPSLYGAKHEIVPLELTRPGWETTQSEIAGPVCETGDFLARDAALPLVLEGAYLCVLDAGAYGMSLASNYNTRPRAAEVLVEGRHARLVRRRENLKDMFRPESSCL